MQCHRVVCAGSLFQEVLLMAPGTHCARHVLRLGCKRDSTFREAMTNVKQFALNHFKANLTYFVCELRTCLHKLEFILCSLFKYCPIVPVP